MIRIMQRKSFNTKKENYICHFLGYDIYFDQLANNLNNSL